jgi:HSF-type DNA-binding
MCISNVGNRRPFPTNGFKSRGGANPNSPTVTIDASSLKASSTTSYSAISSKNHHIVVQHCYHDHAHDSRVDYQEDQPARGGVTVPFPLKLHDMLSAVVENGHEHIVSWQPHGRCFVVHKPKEFTELLPYYFKLSKLASFQRQ